MTQAEAMKEARRRWGNVCGGVRPPLYSPRMLFEVGKSTKEGFVALGSSPRTFESAFADADRKARP